ncbi:Butyryl-CoA dehydrogenase [Hyphomicrobium sulfonivorans]|uniref:Acyl-coenzyme A dehydrogenase n=1 Tax=Hyphomicrobium sulfonivorans TaxID=121290 RepID=A0A109BP87_HYPSL|nr:acyl-CoA dehydrogenase [Hyphomicrobium sulfonivorans]KWT72427.1 Butyryl-CoA dehydrogenase [Hyphomicrobium sulfonivorans]
MVGLMFCVALLGAILVLGLYKPALWAWSAALAIAALLWKSDAVNGSAGLFGALLWFAAASFAALAIPSLRRARVTGPLFERVRGTLPKVSETETQALEAGTVGFDAELFSGEPHWNKLRAMPSVMLTPEEQAFLDGPTEELCGLIDNWKARHQQRDIPEEIWDFAKRHGFLGMLISKAHGGLGFSAQAQSLIIGKIASRSPDAVIIVMVPNSLGPGELIEKYGTDEQKEHYLPRLARGDDIPCFALTGPTSGSDAATMRDIGTVFRGDDGKPAIRLSWDKRYITLAPKATLLGLAFRLLDPDNLLGKGTEPGITVAMIPADHPGVQIGRRHLPSGAAFPNGPTWGRNVVIPADWIIGGEAMAGQGWRMLMECLSAGRAISLPSVATAGSKAMLRFTTAYARLRRQFGLPIARMEGVEEPLARMIETAYASEAARAVTAAMVSRGERPSVLSALMKYQTTERMRHSVNDALDIHGGRAICDGPSNYLQSAYQMVPIGITVEGANILTRTLITFAQGALRSHPYLVDEIKAAQDQNEARGLEEFDRAFSSHAAYTFANGAGAFLHGITGSMFVPAPEKSFDTANWYRHLGRASRSFAFVADLTITTLGGRLKTRQKISGRLADALSELYILACVLKRFEDDGRLSVDRTFVDLAAMNGLYRFQEAMRGAIDNFPVASVRWAMRAAVFPLGARYRPAPDELGQRAVQLVLGSQDVRDRLTRYIYVSHDPDDPTGLLEVALKKAIAAEQAEKKLDRAVRDGLVHRYHGVDWIGEAIERGAVTESEGQQLRDLEALIARVIAVDNFDPAALKPNYRSGSPFSNGSSRSGSNGTGAGNGNGNGHGRSFEAAAE